MLTEADLLKAIERDPTDDLGWLALADWLEENGEADRAELVRLREWLRFSERTDPQRPAKEARMQAMLDLGVRPAGPRLRIPLDAETPLELTLVPAGSFWMGTAGEEGGEGLTETPRHLVTLTKSFWISVYPLTQAQWKALMGDSPSYFRGSTRPVESISWTRARNCCAKLGKRFAGHFRLPTEAEWEYACRAGTYTAFHSGNDQAALDRAGWYLGNSEEGTSNVGQLSPNAWGLHDMHGTLYEWCGDRVRTFSAAPVTDPFGARAGASHCIRGGYYGRPYLNCRSAYRDGYGRGARSSIAGLRMVRNLDAVRRSRRTKA